MTEDAEGRQPAADSPDADAAADQATGQAPAADATDAADQDPQPDVGASGEPAPGGPEAATAGEPDPGAAGRPGAGSAPRHGLIRPRVDRQIAGVCSGIGRATGTDPVLWRVLFAVGVLFGGAGLAAYLIGWLVLPEEGDTASPVEALFGRGRSSTSTLVTVLLAASAVLLLAVTVEWNPFVVVVLAGAGYLLYRQMRGEPLWPPRPMPPAGPPSAPPPPPPMTPPPTPPGPASATPPGAAPVVSPAQAAGVPLREETTTSAEAPTVVMPPSPPRWEPPTAPLPPDPPPPRPRREPSALGRVALFAALLALGLTAALQLAGIPVGFSGYVAALLLTVGAALVLGAWIGRARWLIPVGALLAVTLAVSSAVEATNVRVDGNQVWSPSSTAEIQESYNIGLGAGTLDLTQVDFTGQNVATKISVSAGNMEVILPPDVDVSGVVNVSYGNAQLLDEEISGSRRHDRMFSDLGADGQEGPGHVRLHLIVNGGNLEVRR